MQDQSISDDKGNDPGDLYASIASLAAQGQMPGVGDQVEVQVEGIIHSIEGDAACIKPMSVNGQPIPKHQEKKSKGYNDQEEHDRLLKGAEDQDQQEGNGY